MTLEETELALKRGGPKYAAETARRVLEEKANKPAESRNTNCKVSGSNQATGDNTKTKIRTKS